MPKYTFQGGYPAIGGDPAFTEAMAPVYRFAEDNLRTAEGDVRRRTDAAQTEQGYYRDLAQMARQDAAQDWQQKEAEARRRDLVQQHQQQLAQGRYQFGETQALRREENTAGVGIRREELGARTAERTAQQAEVERNNRFNLIASDIQNNGRQVNEFDTSGFTPTELQSLRNAEEGFRAKKEQLKSMTNEQIAPTNNKIIAAKRRAAEDLIKKPTQADKDRIARTPIDELPELPPEKMAKLTEHLGPTFYANVQANPNQTYSPRPDAYWTNPRVPPRTPPPPPVAAAPAPAVAPAATPPVSPQTVGPSAGVGHPGQRLVLFPNGQTQGWVDARNLPDLLRAGYRELPVTAARRRDIVRIPSAQPTGTGYTRVGQELTQLGVARGAPPMYGPFPDTGPAPPQNAEDYYPFYDPASISAGSPFNR